MGNGASLGLHETNEQGIIQNQKQIVARKGRKTVLVNIVDIAEARNRDPEHLTKVTLYFEYASMGIYFCDKLLFELEVFIFICYLGLHENEQRGSWIKTIRKIN